MGPIELAMAGSGIFGGVGDAIDSGASAGQNQTISQMRTKEVIGSALIGIIGGVLAIKDRTIWPLLVAVGVISLVVFLHEYHASKNSPTPDLAVMTGGNFK